MKKTRRFYVLIFSTIFVLFGSKPAGAQGCSDAGFCTLNALKMGEESVIERPKNGLQFGFNYGAADNNVAVVSSFIDYGHQLNQHLDIHLRWGFVAQNSDIASSAGLSDLFLNVNYSMDNFVLTGGMKIPLTDGNRKLDGLALPMDFQPSLGTFDLILGVGYQVKQLKLTLAMQQPLSQNKNSFLPADYPADSPFAGFQPTNQYIRKGDVLLRASYNLRLNKKWSLIPSVLPIYHLGNDEYTDAGGNQVILKGSQGITLNGNLMVNFEPGKNQSFQLSFASPFVTRDLRPDGLTRSFVVGLEYVLRFR